MKTKMEILQRTNLLMAVYTEVKVDTRGLIHDLMSDLELVIDDTAGIGALGLCGHIFSKHNILNLGRDMTRVLADEGKCTMADYQSVCEILSYHAIRIHRRGILGSISYITAKEDADADDVIFMARKLNDLFMRANRSKNIGLHNPKSLERTITDLVVASQILI